MTPADLRELAEGLSEAQRRAICDGLARYMDPNTTRALRRKGICESRGTMLTMTGLALLDHLMEQSNG